MTDTERNHGAYLVLQTEQYEEHERQVVGIPLLQLHGGRTWSSFALLPPDRLTLEGNYSQYPESEQRRLCIGLGSGQHMLSLVRAIHWKILKKKQAINHDLLKMHHLQCEVK